MSNMIIVWCIVCALFAYWVIITHIDSWLVRHDAEFTRRVYEWCDRYLEPIIIWFLNIVDPSDELDG